MRRHNVFDAGVTRALDVTALDHIPQGHAAVQQHGSLGGNRGVERRRLTACQRVALVGRHGHTEARSHHAPKAVLGVTVIKIIGTREHRGKRPQHQNARVLVKHGLKPMLNMLIALIRRGHGLGPQQIAHLVGCKLEGTHQLDCGRIVGKQVDEGAVEFAGSKGIGLVHGIGRHEHCRVVADALKQ